MKRTFKIISVILSMSIFIICSTASGFAFDYTKYIDGFSNEIIKGYLPQILEESDDITEIDALIWIRYNESFDKSKYAPDDIAKASKEFHRPKNEAFAKTLPEDVKVTAIDNYAPVVCVTATKPQILKIAEMESVCDIWEGEKYTVYLSESGVQPHNKYFNSTMKVNGTDTSFLENEYYKVYADYYGKYFYDKFQSGSIVGQIDDNLYKSIKTVTGEQYITVILNEVQNAENTAKALDIRENDIIAVCQSYPVAMIKITSDDIDSILLHKNVAAVFDAFPAATEPDIVNEEILEETYTPSAADARKVLRYAANLEKAPDDMAEGKKFFFMSDADLDGKITASDARLALRISARLESGKTYFKGSSDFWKESYAD